MSRFLAFLLPAIVAGLIVGAAGFLSIYIGGACIFLPLLFAAATGMGDDNPNETGPDSMWGLLTVILIGLYAVVLVIVTLLTGWFLLNILRSDSGSEMFATLRWYYIPMGVGVGFVFWAWTINEG